MNSEPFTVEYTWQRLNYLVKKISELERKENVNEKEVWLMKRYKKEFALIVAKII